MRLEAKMFLAQANQKLQPEETDRQTHRARQTDDLKHYLYLFSDRKYHKHALNCESLHFLL